MPLDVTGRLARNSRPASLMTMSSPAAVPERMLPPLPPLTAAWWVRCSPAEGKRTDSVRRTYCKVLMSYLPKCYKITEREGLDVVLDEMHADAGVVEGKQAVQGQFGSPVGFGYRA